MKSIGYDRPLFVQPFDHRGSFTKKFFGLAGPPEVSPRIDHRTAIAQTKMLIYRGLLRAIELGVPKDTVGILVDAEFGSQVLLDAQARGITTSVCVEKSGQPVFDFEYGPRWQDHLRFIKPEIVKCLVRYHPKDDAVENREQATRLQALSDYIHDGNDHYLMFELLVPALTAEEKALGDRYDKEVRPERMIEAIHQLQDFGIEPDIWKIEGLETRSQAEAVGAATRRGKGRGRVGNILLGRGSDKAQVHKWLQVAAPVPGYIGFAVGRTNFADAVKGFIADPSTEAQAIETIAANYKGCVDVWQAARGQA
jgi:5-dehydro-2-deoxygluconokinase